MLCDLSKSQDVEAGDGTTSVVVIAGSLLSACTSLLEKGIHPTQINEAFGRAQVMAAEILESVAIPVDLDDRESLISAATTSLSSKVVIFPLCDGNSQSLRASGHLPVFLYICTVGS
jgi:T-complex protein 1 subunit delta